MIVAYAQLFGKTLYIFYMFYIILYYRKVSIYHLDDLFIGSVEFCHR